MNDSMLPQLRVRTECSFRAAFGPVDRVAARLAEIQTPLAACCDVGGTWAHVKFMDATANAGVSGALGVELNVDTGDGRSASALALALAPAEFYRFTSSNPQTEADWIAAKGEVLRLSGAALTDPEAFDFVSLSPDSVTAALRNVDLARRTGKPLCLIGDNAYPAPLDREQYLALTSDERPSPQHILGDRKEWREAFWFLDEATFVEAWRGTFAAAEKLWTGELPTAPIISVEGDLRALTEEGRQYRLREGHIKDWTEEYQQRLDRELDMIEQKDYQSYFVVVSDLIRWSKERMLVGPGRGSSAGSLVCYLLEITEVDPLVHGLIFERFIDVNRDDLPDIDIDFSDRRRHLAIEYLAEKYGQPAVARIGNVSRLKARSVISQAARRFGIPIGATFSVTNVLIEYSSGDSRYGRGLEDTLETTRPGQEFTQRYPEFSIAAELENHAWHTSVHAAGVIVCNVPVTQFCTVTPEGVAQIDKKDAERLNLLKIDCLGLRTLGVIEDTGRVEPRELYGLTLDDPEVFDVFNRHRFAGVFQFEGGAQRRVSTQLNIDSFRLIDHITALARPGPLGGGATEKYIRVANGDDAVSYRHPSMEAYLGDTNGVVLYQEQVMRIVRELGQFSWEETSVIRKAMSGRKGEEFFNRRGELFVEGAAEAGIDAERAEAIWNEICSFGAWGMNRSHTVSYAVISYWCAYMKRHHPLDFAAALLRTAKDDEQTVEMLRELRDEGVRYIPFDPDRSRATWAAIDGDLVGGFDNLIGVGPVKAQHYVQKRDTDGLTDADRERLTKLKVKHDDLAPAHTLWGPMYDDPEAHNVHGRIKEFEELEDGENAVVICRLVKKERRDQNEAIMVAKRHGERKRGQTQFLDMFVVDDSVSKPIRLRIPPKLWARYGQTLADGAKDKQDWFLVRGKWLGRFTMMSADKIKCLSNPELV